MSTPENFKPVVSYKLFISTYLSVLTVIILGGFYEESLYGITRGLYDNGIEKFGWIYSIAVTVFLLICIWLLFSRHGKIKLGGPLAKPHLSTFSWWSISLTAGLGASFCFFGVAEPLFHYAVPPPFEGINFDENLAALKYAYFHWGLHTYAIYTCAGLAMALAYYNSKLPFRVSSGLYGLLGDRIKGGVGTATNMVAIFTAVGSLCTMLALGLMDLNPGFSSSFGLDIGRDIDHQVLYLILLIVLVAIFIFSSCSGLYRSIKIISLGNVYIYFAFMFLVLLAGPAGFIITNSFTSFFDYLLNLPGLSFFSLGLSDTNDYFNWATTWSQFYWVIAIAPAPVLGLFLARLAYGRTVRAFILINLVFPSLFVLLWFGILGSSAISMGESIASIMDVINQEGISGGFFAFVNILPQLTTTNTAVLIAVISSPPVTNIVAWIAIIGSLVTLAQAVISTVSSMNITNSEVTADGAKYTLEAPNQVKILWGATIGVGAGMLLLTGGIGARVLQLIVAICSIPMLIIICLMVVSMIKWLGNPQKYDRFYEAPSGVLSKIKTETEG